MKKLLVQIIKFGFVGGLCFIIDYVISILVFDILINTASREVATLTGGFVGFTVSVIVNYILSMKYVFVRKEGISRKKEFTVFVVLSVIGLGINEITLLACSALYEANDVLMSSFGDTLWFAISKAFAAGIVMVYNFISRKIFLENKNEKEE